MAPLTDPQLLNSFKRILDEWNVTDSITAKDIVLEWINKNLPDFDLKQIGKLLHNYLVAGGEIDQVRETRPEWNTRDYHYDFRLPILGKMRYIETILVDDDPTYPYLHLVSIHDV